MRILPIIILFALVVAALYLPITIPYTVRSMGMVYPEREWKLLKDDAGNLTTTLQDFRTGVISSGSNFQFERGDLARMSLHFDPATHPIVELGDTVLDIFTVRLDDQILALEGELAAARAELRSVETGEKSPIVQEAENKLVFARQDLDLKQRVFDIKKQLYEDKVIAMLEFREAENARDLAKTQTEVIQKTLETARTGLKPEDVELTRRRIRALENRIRYLLGTKAGYRVLAPFRGRVIPSILETDVLVLQTPDTFIVQVPVPVEQVAWLGDSPPITVQDMASRRTFTAKLLKINPKVEIVNNRQVVFLQTAITPGAAAISTGLGAICTIKTGDLNVRDYLRRTLHF